MASLDIRHGARPQPALNTENPLFGAYLIEQGIVSLETVVQALNQQRKQQKPIGAVAVDAGLMSEAQVFELLNEQSAADQGTRVPLGQLAKRRGWLNDAELSKLLQAQKQSRPQLGEILVGMKALSQAELERNLIAFHARTPAVAPR